MTSAGSVVLPLLVSVAALIALKLGASAAPARVCADMAQESRLSASHATAHNTSSSADEAFSRKNRISPAFKVGANDSSAERGAGIR